MTNTTKYVLTGIATFILVSAGILAFWAIDLINAEVSLHNKIIAQQEANKAEFDNMKKKIKQNTAVSDKYKDGLIEVLTAYTEGRHTDGEKLFMKWSNEAVPVLDSEMYQQLSNIITSSRDKFTSDQKQLLDLQREYNVLVNTFPNSLLFKAKGVDKIEVIVVTSTETDKAFESGKDDDTGL